MQRELSKAVLKSKAVCLLICLLAGIAGLSGCARSPVVPPPKSALPASVPASNGFRDISTTSGLAAFLHCDGSSGRKFFPEQMGSGVAIFDYDGDGWPDVYFCSGAPLPGYKGPAPRNYLFRNRHDGTFEDVTLKAGVACNRFCVGVAVGDYDNDGHLDLYVTGFGGNTLYHNNGNGTFTDVTAKARVGCGKLCSSATWVDVDGDGWLDLWVCSYVQYRLDEDLYCNVAPAHKSYCGPNLYKPEHSTLYHNNGDGTFTDISRQAGLLKDAGNGLGVVALDYDEDGKPDVFVANDQSPNHLWHNNGKGGFTNVAHEMGTAFGEQGTAKAGMGVDIGDYDNDGKYEILVSNFSEEADALYHWSDGVYRDAAFSSGIGPATLMYLGFGTGFLDYDRDGYLDVFFANGHVMDDIGEFSDSISWAQPNLLFHNRGNGTFEDVSRQTGVGEGKRVGRGAAFGDLFNDGHTDIIVSALRGHPLVLKNECAPNAHWLELDLRASWGNPQAIGAHVWLTAGGKTQRRDVKTGGGYASASDIRPLFGLGSDTQVEELKIKWPSGQTTRLKGPPIDRIMRIQEPPFKQTTGTR